MVILINEEIDPNIDYEWLTSKVNIRTRYIEEYVENYVYNVLSIVTDNKWIINEPSLLYELDSVSEYSSLLYQIDDSNEYEYRGRDGYNFTYGSIDCKYSHKILLQEILEDTKYSATVILEDTNMSDEDLIELYDNNDKILLGILESDNA